MRTNVPEAAEQLLTGLGRARRQSLGLDGGRQPVVLDRHRVGDHLLQQIGAGRRIGLGPRDGVVGDLVDDRAQRGHMERRALRHCAVARPGSSPVGATAPRLVMVMVVTLPRAPLALSGSRAAQERPRPCGPAACRKRTERPAPSIGGPGRAGPATRSHPGQATRGSTSSDEQCQVVQVVEIEHLQVDGVGPDAAELLQPRHDLVGRAGDRMGPELVHLAPDVGGAALHLGVVRRRSTRSARPTGAA